MVFNSGRDALAQDLREYRCRLASQRAAITGQPAAQHAAAARAARWLAAHAITAAARRIADRQAQREEQKDG